MSLLTDEIEIKVAEAELGTAKALGSLPPIVRWLVILAVIATIPAYFIAKSVSNHVWLARYAPGIPAAHPSFTNPKPLPTINVTVTTLGNNTYSALVKFANPNLDLSLQNVPYQFVFFNDQKQELYRAGGTLFLLPNQTKYITTQTFTAPGLLSYANFEIADNLPWQKRLNIPKVELQTSLPQTSYQTSPQALAANGEVYNNSPYQVSKVHLTFVLYDYSGQIIGLSSRDEFTLQPYEHRAYQQLWPGVAAPNLARVEVAAETNTLDPLNLKVPDQTPGSSSDLSRPSTK